MKCPNCGKDVKEGSKFCVGCGTSLAGNETKNVEEISSQDVHKTDEVKEKVATKVNEVKEAAKRAADSDFMKVVLSSLMFLLNILLKPIKVLKEKIEFYSKPQNGFILAGVVALATMIVRVVVSLVMALIQKQCTSSFLGSGTCLTVGEKIQAIDWMGITLKHLLIILIVMFAIAGIYYVASLIAKKTTNFMRILTITAVSLVPACVASYLLVPIFGWINAHFGVIVAIIGFVYSLVIFFASIKDEFTFDNADMNVYFHLICVSIIIIIAYFVGYNILVNTVTNSVTSGLDGLGNLGF